MFFNKKNSYSNLDISTYIGFENAYNAYAPKMYKIGLSQTKDQEASKEIIQEIFKSLWERRHKLQLKGPLENYLMRALKLKIIDYYRSHSSAGTKVQLLIEDTLVASNGTEDDLIYKELQARVDRVLGKLSDKRRTIFNMKHQQGMSTKEIAASLTISERAVTYHLVGAKASIQEELMEYRNGSGLP